MAEPRPPICDYEGSDYQERFWEHADRRYEDRAEALALRRLLPSGGARLLELGAGAGRNTPRYRGFGEVVLLDYSRSQLERARGHLGGGPGYRYVAADAYRLPFAPGVFDAATMIRTLHHMADPEAALRQVRAALAPGASFVLEFPNKRNLKAIGRWLLRRQAWNPFDPAPIEFARLNFDFHPRAVRAWLAGSGFEVERLLSVSHFRLALLKRLVPLPLLVDMERLAQPTGRWWLLSPSVFVRSRAAGGGAPAPDGAFWRCLACDGIALDESAEGLRCTACGRLWPQSDGIYDFRGS
jgi:SAM-dependent methyltransferase